MTLLEFTPANIKDLDSFVARWQDADGTERANYQLFLTELCSLLGLPLPEPSGENAVSNSYVFERRVDINNPDGSSNRGYIDLYKSGCFVLEAKQTGKVLDSQGWDKAMLRAQNQADQYVRALPTDEGRPPFIVVTDVGRSLELYSEFSCSGGTYVPFPDPGHHRIRLEDLRIPEIQERLRNLWLNPDKLDPSKYAARVTRDVSAKLAELARSLEQQNYEVERVAHFLKRCLFTMFSEDVGLLPENSFTHLLQAQRETPENFPFALKSLWESMNTGGYSPVLNHTVRQFNGGLFKDIDPIPLDADQIQLLIEAAKADWRFVEPAIFGTLLERALDPRERHKLGAHFTPRAYVERLVMPTLIDPLREQWSTARIAAEAWLQQGKPEKALIELRAFHHQLCQTRVLDPACGSGNFLYVALEHLKRLEGEVLNLIRDLSAGQASFDTEGLTVDPHQFLGIELNPRAAAIAEIVLWIGYLQWHYRIHGKLDIPDPILKDFHNIECRDALIDFDSRDPILGEDGRPITIWDGITYKESPATGELVPDETGRVSLYSYANAREVDWPDAEYIVGNPPFIGKLNMRSALGDGYVDALRKTYKGEVPDSADLVMYWWHKAAERVQSGDAIQFGFIATNSLTQTFNRRVVESHMLPSKRQLSLIFAIPDHPWVDSSDGAAVRISLTVGRQGDLPGVLKNLVGESRIDDDLRTLEFQKRRGKIHSDLTIGAAVSESIQLKANRRLSATGVIPHGEGMLLTKEQAIRIGWSENGPLENYIKPYRNGKDILSTSRNLFVIDLYGLGSEEVKQRFPELYQWLLDRVKPQRDVNRDKDLREKWWLHRRSNEDMRSSLSGLPQFIATVMTAKHRVFTYLNGKVLPDQVLVSIASDCASILGVLSSRIHVLWALATGGTLEDRPRYNKSRCFETFPFPIPPKIQAELIDSLAEKLDAHRKRRQVEHPELTLTAMYNVLEKLRSEEALTAKEKTIHEQGLVSILKELHDHLDRAVFEAYGWSDLADRLVGRPGATTPLPDKPADQSEAEQELLIRLVALNDKRAAEEANGIVRWLRPDYQAPDARQVDADLAVEIVEKAGVAVTLVKQAWPKAMPEQVAIVRATLSKGPLTIDALAAHFKRKPIKGIEQVLAALQVLGHAEIRNELWRLS